MDAVQALIYKAVLGPMQLGRHTLWPIDSQENSY